ncbi:MAG: hypothetical protein FWH18_02995 [Marinilabiliaceae bacterium]|nr:hypothetical protein [Marinilabiliaceae bacterium]
MKTIDFFKYIAVLLLMVDIISCQKTDPSTALSDEQISLNLSKSGKIDPELLIGEWDCVKFAYTVEGKKISNVVAISQGRLTIPFAYSPDDDNGLNRWELQVVNSIMYVCSMESNYIELFVKRTTYINVVPPHLEYDLMYALENALSFVIKENELIIYFPKIEDENRLSQCSVVKNKNLLILKKR